MSKRARAPAGAEAAAAPAPAVPEPVAAPAPITASSIDADFEAAVGKIRNGSYRELARLSEGLNRVKEKKIAAADKHRKLQIKNINDLYEYEVSDATARYKRAYEETQERLITELSNEVRRLKAKLGSSSSNSNNSSGAGAAAGGEVAESNGGGAAAGGRQAPKSTTASPDEGGGDDENSLTNFVHGKEKDRALRRRLGVPPNQPTSLDPLLPEETMRADFLEIVQDIRARAAAFGKSAAKPVASSSVSVAHDPAVLKVGANSFGVGELVVVFSVLSQESLSGIITSITDQDVVVRCGSGARFSFLVGQLREGRVTISKDVASESAARLISDAAT